MARDPINFGAGPNSRTGDTLRTAFIKLDGDVGELFTRLEEVEALLALLRTNVTYTEVAGSPFTLTSSWTKVATTSALTKAFRVGYPADTTVYDIEWVSVAAGSSTPTTAVAEGVLAGDAFPEGIPIGDIYLRSATGQIAIVKTGA